MKHSTQKRHVKSEALSEHCLEESGSRKGASPEALSKSSKKIFSIKERDIQAVIDKMSAIMDALLTRFGAESPEKEHLFIMLFVTISFSALCHIIQILIFLFAGNLLLAAINFGSICVYVVCIIMLFKRKPAVAGMLFTIEITVVAAILLLLMGGDISLISYFFILLLVQMIIPYAGWKVRIPVILAVFVLMFASYWIILTYPPPIDITPIKISYSIFNISLGAGSVVAIVAVNNFVNYMVAQLHKAKLDQYMSKAHLDELTGLYNRRYAHIVFDEIGSDSEQEDRWCVAMLDIDDFKQVNDQYGHNAGDTVLRDIANSIKTSLRKTDHVFRWGGEEFLILIRDSDIYDAYNTLEKMRKTIQDRKIEIGALSIELTVTIGLCECIDGDIAQSVELSDKNLYKGKSTGKNVVVR